MYVCNKAFLTIKVVYAKSDTHYFIQIIWKASAYTLKIQVRKNSVISIINKNQNDYQCFWIRHTIMDACNVRKYFTLIMLKIQYNSISTGLHCASWSYWGSFKEIKLKRYSEKILHIT